MSDPEDFSTWANPDLRKSYRDAALNWIKQIDGERANWNLETVKNLIIGNAAGLAGAGAFASTGKRSPPMFLCFGAGILFGMACLYVGTLAYSRHATSIAAAIETLDVTPSMDPRILLRPRDGPAKAFERIGVALGWLSAIAAALGIVYVYEFVS